MRRVLPSTLFGQLLVGTVLAQVLLLGGYVTYLVISQRHLAEERTRQRMAQQLGRLAAACSRPLEQQDTVSLRGVLELSRISPSIEIARVTDLAGKTLAVTESGRDRGLDAEELRILAGPPRQRIFSVGSEELEAVTPVAVHGKAAALLWIEPNRTLPRNTLETILRICLIYGGFALLANILPLFLIVRTVTKPLGRLRRATKQVVRHQELKGEFPLPVTTGNEAGDLTASFNTMVEELARQRAGLLETVALLDSMLGNAPTGFAFFDRDLRYVKLNGFLADMFGLSVGEHLRQRASEAGSEPMLGTIEEQLRLVFATGGSVRNVEVTGSTPKAPEEQRHWLLHFYPVHPPNEEAVKWAGVIVVDITERLQAEEALRRTEKLAAAGRLAASIAHEINNPLESVTNLLYLLETHGSLDATASEFVATAQAELARVSEITQQTLRFYKQSSLPSHTNVAETLDSIAALYQARLHAAQIQVLRQYRGNPKTFGFGGELRQVFANLIGNAIDAMPGGGILTLRARRGYGRGADGEWRHGVRIAVADTGTGMSRETMGRIFEAFFTTKQATGTGLGLWVSEEIVRKHCGRVEVRSRQGANSGTVFELFFPEGGLVRQGTAAANAEIDSLALVAAS